MVGPSTFMTFINIKEIGQIKSVMTTSYVFNISALLVAYAFIHGSIPVAQAAIGIAVMSAGKTFYAPPKNSNKEGVNLEI
jgi:hypothetical protein